MDASTALALEVVADRAVAMELTRAMALTMAAQVMRGASAMVLDGKNPAHIKEETSTPGGCTFGGLLVLEENAVRGSTPRAVWETTIIASQLGQGMKNMNGTRF
jgi:pyrroline-5-carboxylate reductase